MMASDKQDAVTLAAALRDGAERLRNSETARLDARVLLKSVTSLDDAGLIARSNEPLSKEQRRLFDEALVRRAQGEPVAYITGMKEFWGMAFRVSPATLIPRPDSECLIEAVLARRSVQGRPAILDLGVGSGCLLCALLAEFPQASGIGVDRAEAAAAVARSNIAALGFSARAGIVVGDWTVALTGLFDIIVANPPYIREGDRAGLAVEIRAHEPPHALFAGPDGLAAYRAILADARRLVAPGGLVVLECGADQSGALLDMVSTSFPNCEHAVIKDLNGLRRGVLADCGRRVTKKD